MSDETDDVIPPVLSPAEVDIEQAPLIAQTVRRMNEKLVQGVRVFTASLDVPIGHQPAVAAALRKAGWVVDVVTQRHKGHESTFLRVRDPRSDTRLS